MVGLGFRTIKTALGAGLAIWIASLLHLEFATFAAIIVIMCIEKTKKKTLLTMKKKFFACLLSLILGAVFFEVLGYHPIAFSLFILIFVPILVKMRIQDGFVTSMVVLLHIYTIKEVSLGIFLNEFYIIIIGMGIALLVNSIMPNFKQAIETNKQNIERKFSIILYEFSAYLKDSKRLWDGKEIVEAEDLINRGKNIVIQDVENHLSRNKNKDYYYLEMREDQLELLKHMITIVAIVASSELHVKQKGMFAEFLEYLSQNVHSGDTTDIMLNQLEELKVSIRETELPKTREEFEIRANLFYLIFEIENFLRIKQKLFAKRRSRSRISQKEKPSTN